MLKFFKKYLGVIMGFLAILIGALLIVFLANQVNLITAQRKNLIDKGLYQAVFLSNNQIYFGRLKNPGSDYLILTDVYYVKINEGGAGQLVKLGQIEPHGPKDEMIINREHILFWENMKPDSPVVKTIQSMQLQGK